MSIELPDPDEMLPQHRVGNAMCRSSLSVLGWSCGDAKNYLDQALEVCKVRGFKVQAIRAPDVVVTYLNEGPWDEVFNLPSYAGIALYQHDGWPITGELELAFSC